MVSRHRQLKDAQEGVNDAVAKIYDMVDGPDGTDALLMHSVLDLMERWEEFDRLRRDLEGPSAHAARDTSANAAKGLPPLRAGHLRRTIVSTLVAHRAHFRDGLTCKELEARLHKTHENVSPQVNYLENSGWIRNSGRTRVNPSGRDAIVWEPTEAAIEAVRDWNLGAAS